MAIPAGKRKAVEQWEARVVRHVDVSPHVRRITLAAPELETFQPSCFDEYVGLMVPRPGERDALRWYSVRHHRRDVGELDTDIVLHGTNGPGTTWASSVAPDSTLFVRVGGGDYEHLPTEGENHLFVADETSMPALAAVADAWLANGSPGSVHAVVELPTDDFESDIPDGFPVTRLLRGDDKPGSLAIDHVMQMTLPDLDFAWLCGESRLATTLRRHVVRERGVDRKRVAFSGYWRA